MVAGHSMGNHTGKLKMSAGGGGGNDDKCLDQFNGINILPPIIRSEKKAGIIPCFVCQALKPPLFFVKCLATAGELYCLFS